MLKVLKNGPQLQFQLHRQGFFALHDPNCGCNSCISLQFPAISRIVTKTATWPQFKTLLISRPKTTHEATKGQKQINQTALVFTATIWNEPYLTKLAYCKVQCWMLKQPPAQLSTKLTIRLKKQASIRFVIYIFQATDEVKNPIE